MELERVAGHWGLFRSLLGREEKATEAGKPMEMET